MFWLPPVGLVWLFGLTLTSKDELSVDPESFSSSAWPLAWRKRVSLPLMLVDIVNCAFYICILPSIDSSADVTSKWFLFSMASLVS